MKKHEYKYPTCHTLIDIDQTYCHYHCEHGRLAKRTDDQRYNRYQRNQQANTFYHSPQWTKLRNYVVTRDMYISGVSGKVLGNKDIIVDHIVRRDICINPFDANNLWLLSRAEHNLKTKIEQRLMQTKNGIKTLRSMTRGDWQRILKHRS